MRPVTYSWLVVVLGVACAAIGWLGIAGWIAVAVALASVGMHVAGNALGTRLREATDRDLARLAGTFPPAPPLPRVSPTLLERRSDLGRLTIVSGILGAVCGGVIGAVALRLLVSASVAGTLLGGLSSAVVGGFVGFLAASFVAIVRSGLKEAIAAERHGLPDSAN